MAVTVQEIPGSQCIGDSLPTINTNFSELAKFVAPDFPLSNIQSAAHSVNIDNKQIGKVIFDSTTNRLLVAAGSNPTDRWWVVDGSSSVLPS